MTIAAGFLFEEGILLCADTMYTSSMRVNQTKLFSHRYSSGNIAFALAGSDCYGKMAIQDCIDAISALSPTGTTSTSKIKKIVRGVVRSIHEEHIYKIPAGQQDDARFQLLVAIYCKVGGLQLLSSLNTAVTAIDTYECIGMGSYLARYLIDPLYLQHGMSQREILTIATQVLSAVKDYDANCGGESEMIALRSDGNMLPFNREEISRGEQFIGRYNSEARKLLASVASRDIDDGEFERRLCMFSEAAREIRKSWRQIIFLSARFDPEITIQGVLSTPPPTKRD